MLMFIETYLGNCVGSSPVALGVINWHLTDGLVVGGVVAHLIESLFTFSE